MKNMMGPKLHYFDLMFVEYSHFLVYTCTSFVSLWLFINYI